MIEESDIQNSRKKGFIVLLFSALLVIATFFALDQFNITDIRTTLLSANPLYITLSFIAMSLAFLGMGMRWRALMPCNPPVLPLSGIVCAGLLLNYATPGPLGELAAAYFASRRYPLTLSQALASGVIARLVGLISAALFGAFLWVFAPLSITAELLLPIQLISMFCLLIGLGLLSLILFSSFWISLAERWRSTSDKPTSRIQKLRNTLTNGIIQLCLDASSLYKSPISSYRYALLWSCFSHCAVIFGIIFLGLALNAEFSVIGIMFTYAVTTAGAVLLFALPGSYIGWDALFLGLLLSTAEMTQAQSFAIVGIVRLQQLSYMLLGGISLNWLIKESPPQP